MSVVRKDKIQDWMRKEKRAAADALLKAAELAAVYVQNETPVQTGNLKANIQPTNRIEEVGDGVIKTAVNTPVTYAPYVEYGTSKMAPRAMFRKGIANGKSAIVATFERILRANLG